MAENNVNEELLKIARETNRDYSGTHLSLKDVEEFEHEIDKLNVVSSTLIIPFAKGDIIKKGAIINLRIGSSKTKYKVTRVYKNGKFNVKIVE